MEQYAKDGRILYIDRIRECYIMYKSTAIGKLIHEFSSISGEHDWIIIPFWDVIDSFGGRVSIPGIDDINRQEKYIRLYDPYFVTQRTFPVCKGRMGELNRWLKMLNMKMSGGAYDLYEFMCRGHARQVDGLYVSRTPDKVIDVHLNEPQFDIPDFDTDKYGWLEDYVNKE